MTVDWHAIWSPEQPPLETMVRASLVYLVVHALLRLAGRKELSRYSSFDLAVLFLVTVAARRSITVDDASVTTAALALATLVAWNVPRAHPQPARGPRARRAPAASRWTKGPSDQGSPHALRRAPGFRPVEICSHPNDPACSVQVGSEASARRAESSW